MKHNYPNWLDMEAWSEYKQHRCEIRKPLTPLAEKKAINKLAEIVDQCQASQQQVIDQTIMNGWVGLFPVRSNNYGTSNQVLRPAFNSAQSAIQELQTLGYRTGFEEEADSQSSVSQNVIHFRNQVGE